MWSAWITCLCSLSFLPVKKALTDASPGWGPQGVRHLAACLSHWVRFEKVIPCGPFLSQGTPWHCLGKPGGVQARGAQQQWLWDSICSRRAHSRPGRWIALYITIELSHPFTFTFCQTEGIWKEVTSADSIWGSVGQFAGRRNFKELLLMCSQAYCGSRAVCWIWKTMCYKSLERKLSWML